MITTSDTDDLLHQVTGHCAALVSGGSAGIVLMDDADQPRLAAVTTTGHGVEQLFDVHTGTCPATDAARTGRIVTVEDLVAGRQDPAGWSRQARILGYRSAHAIPLRLRDQVIGALTILDTQRGPLPPAALAAARAFADVAAIALLTRAQADRSAVLAGQLQLALDTRVVIEQAKGIIAGALNLSVDEAFDLLRHNSRHTDTPLVQIARDITTRTISFRNLVWPVHPGWDRGL